MIQFPIKYVDLNYPEHDLFEISDVHWNHDVDARQTIGPNQSDAQFVLDAINTVYAVIFLGLDAENVPDFKFAICENETKRNEVVSYIDQRSNRICSCNCDNTTDLRETNAKHPQNGG